MMSRDGQMQREHDAQEQYDVQGRPAGSTLGVWTNAAGAGVLRSSKIVQGACQNQSPFFNYIMATYV